MRTPAHRSSPQTVRRWHGDYGRMTSPSSSPVAAALEGIPPRHEGGATSDGAWSRHCCTEREWDRVSLMAKKLIGVAVAIAVVGAVIALYVADYLLAYPTTFAASVAKA